MNGRQAAIADLGWVVLGVDAGSVGQFDKEVFLKAQPLLEERLTTGLLLNLYEKNAT